MKTKFPYQSHRLFNKPCLDILVWSRSITGYSVNDNSSSNTNKTHNLITKSVLNETKQTISRLKLPYKFVKDPTSKHIFFDQLHRERIKRYQKLGFNDQSGSHKTICWKMLSILSISWNVYESYWKYGLFDISCLHWIRYRLQEHKQFWSVPNQCNQALELATSPKDSIMKLKYSGLYIWILNSINKSAQDFLAKESDNHHWSGPLDWKLITTNILRGAKQGICRTKTWSTCSTLRSLTETPNT